LEIPKFGFSSHSGSDSGEEVEKGAAEEDNSVLSSIDGDNAECVDTLCLTGEDPLTEAKRDPDEKERREVREWK
jgi:hypothetical protein